MLLEILGEDRRPQFGLPEALQSLPPAPHFQETDYEYSNYNSSNNNDAPVSQEIKALEGEGAGATQQSFSLEDMEAMLAGGSPSAIKGRENNAIARDEDIQGNLDVPPPLAAQGTTGGPTAKLRPAWALCESWEACSLGTLPGHVP